MQTRCSGIFIKMPRPPIKVLLVEDNENDAINIRYLLRSKTLQTYEVDWASTYAEGRTKLQQGGHDVALFDYRLGEKTGIDLLQVSIADGFRIPIILLTGAESMEIDLAASSAGAADYLDKNALDTSRLERSIRYSLRHAATLQTLRESQRQLELFMKYVPSAIAIQDDQGRYVYVNDTFGEMVGRKTEDLINMKETELWPEFDTEERREEGREILKNLQAKQIIQPVFTANRQRHWLTSRFPMVQGDSPPMLGMAAIDITERVKATQVLDGIVSNLPVIVGRLDENGKITEVAGLGLRRFGREVTDWIGLNLIEVLPQFEDKMKQALEGASVVFSLEGGRDGQPWHLENHFFFDKAQGRGSIFFSHDVTEQKELEKQLLRISDDEQHRLGRDLHDGLGQHLTGIALMTSTLQSRLRAEGSAEADQAQTITELVQEAIAQTRALSQGLCPVQLEKYGLQTALEGLAHNIQLLYEIDCDFETNTEVLIHDTRVAIHLYRITQEAINNAIKHGHATHISLRLTMDDSQNELLVMDNGSGFSMGEDYREKMGMGLRLMQYRAGMIGGALKITAEVGKGTQIQCIFPNLHFHASESEPKELLE